jgi:hypothetical protein
MRRISPVCKGVKCVSLHVHDGNLPQAPDDKGLRRRANHNCLTLCVWKVPEPSRPIWVANAGTRMFVGYQEFDREWVFRSLSGSRPVVRR